MVRTLRDDDRLLGPSFAARIKARFLVEALRTRQQRIASLEHRLGRAARAGNRKVARHREDVVKALAVQQPRLALERVAVEVLASEVNDHLLARVKRGLAERGGRELRVAAGVVGRAPCGDVFFRKNGKIQIRRTPVRPGAGANVRRARRSTLRNAVVPTRRARCDCAG